MFLYCIRSWAGESLLSTDQRDTLRSIHRAYRTSGTWVRAPTPTVPSPTWPMKCRNHTRPPRSSALAWSSPTATWPGARAGGSRWQQSRRAKPTSAYLWCRRPKMWMKRGWGRLPTLQRWSTLQIWRLWYWAKGRSRSTPTPSTASSSRW